ncbi:MAG: hypothetical protein H0W72_01985 [Planctomycetes bacterium]|nr:hypothetical protein [Planctomycetota bacterium]
MIRTLMLLALLVAWCGAEAPPDLAQVAAGHYPPLSGATAFEQWVDLVDAARSQRDAGNADDFMRDALPRLAILVEREDLPPAALAVLPRLLRTSDVADAAGQRILVRVYQRMASAPLVDEAPKGIDLPLATDSSMVEYAILATPEPKVPDSALTTALNELRSQGRVRGTAMRRLDAWKPPAPEAGVVDKNLLTAIASDPRTLTLQQRRDLAMQVPSVAVRPAVLAAAVDHILAVDFAQNPARELIPFLILERPDIYAGHLSERDAQRLIDGSLRLAPKAMKLSAWLLLDAPPDRVRGYLASVATPALAAVSVPSPEAALAITMWPPPGSDRFEDISVAPLIALSMDLVPANQFALLQAAVAATPRVAHPPWAVETAGRVSLLWRASPSPLEVLVETSWHRDDRTHRQSIVARPSAYADYFLCPVLAHIDGVHDPRWTKRPLGQRALFARYFPHAAMSDEAVSAMVQRPIAAELEVLVESLDLLRTAIPVPKYAQHERLAQVLLTEAPAMARFDQWGARACRVAAWLGGDRETAIAIAASHAGSEDAPWDDWMDTLIELAPTHDRVRALPDLLAGKSDSTGRFLRWLLPIRLGQTATAAFPAEAYRQSLRGSDSQQVLERMRKCGRGLAPYLPQLRDPTALLGRFRGESDPEWRAFASPVVPLSVRMLAVLDHIGWQSHAPGAKLSE